jgi:hypothetical protein
MLEIQDFLHVKPGASAYIGGVLEAVGRTEANLAGGLSMTRFRISLTHIGLALMALSLVAMRLAGPATAYWD